MPATPSRSRKAVITVVVLGALLAAAHWREAISATFPTAFQVLYTAPFAGTSPATRTQHAKNSDLVSVKEFGALGNGATNDEAAFALARTAAGAGGTVVVPCPGTYLTTTWGTLPCGVALSGPAVAGVLPEANGGTGTGSLSCSSGQAVTSNGTVFSCIYPSASPVLSGRKQLQYMIVSDSTATYDGVSNGGSGIVKYGTGSAGAAALPTRLAMQVNVTASQFGTEGFVTASGIARAGWSPKMTGVVQLLSVSNMVHWMTLDANTGAGCGLGSGAGTQFTASAGGSSACANAVAGIIQDSRGTSPTKWLCCSGDGTTTSCIDTGVTIATATDYVMTVNLTSSLLTCTINSTTVTKATNLPAAGTALKAHWSSMNSAAGANSGPYFSSIFIDENN